jgi:hypothetical protein
MTISITSRKFGWGSEDCQIALGTVQFPLSSWQEPVDLSDAETGDETCRKRPACDDSGLLNQRGEVNGNGGSSKNCRAAGCEHANRRRDGEGIRKLWMLLQEAGHLVLPSNLLLLLVFHN